MTDPQTRPDIDGWQCEHYACRCARANELAAMADRTGRTSLLLDAIGVHSQRVTCRLPVEQQTK